MGDVDFFPLTWRSLLFSILGDEPLNALGNQVLLIVLYIPARWRHLFELRLWRHLFEIMATIWGRSACYTCRQVAGFGDSSTLIHAIRYFVFIINAMRMACCLGLFK